MKIKAYKSELEIVRQKNISADKKSITMVEVYSHAI